MQKLSFVLGAGIGYVLGARSGRSRYEQIVSGAQQVAHNPKVQSATEIATTQAMVIAGKAGATAKDTAANVQAKVNGALHRDQPTKESPDFGAAATYPQTGTPGAVKPGVPDQQVQ
jgi:hypothetical protein